MVTAFAIFSLKNIKELGFKNYLKEVELADMGQLVNGVLELAERMAKRHSYDRRSAI
jgi:hypothetical protein